MALVVPTSLVSWITSNHKKSASSCNRRVRGETPSEAECLRILEESERISTRSSFEPLILGLIAVVKRSFVLVATWSRQSTSGNSKKANLNINSYDRLEVQEESE